MGNTSVTLKPYLYPSGLEDFDEDAPLPLKLAFRGHCFKKVADLEYLLKQRELCREDDSPIRAPQSRDIQAGNVVRDRFDPKCQARVHVVQRETVFREVTPGARAMARTQAMNVGEDYFPL
ncbi:hypothetical protein PR002_g17161 [Phytophthora rubi]|uniref:Uncharacterized protein n=1 Tax=Phytophthora rubi TaxID=129364 RepID=A0A6A3KA86_9STRA|nr:hypothetical protein PR002_g17161 [Phytophthora rubi]